MIHIIYNIKTVNTLIHGTFYFRGKMCSTSTFQWIIITWAFFNHLNILLHYKYFHTTNYFITRKISTSLKRQITPKGSCTNDFRNIPTIFSHKILTENDLFAFLNIILQIYLFSMHRMWFISILLFTFFMKIQLFSLQ